MRPEKPTLSDFVDEDLKNELEVVKDQGGNIWITAGWVGFILLVIWLTAFFIGAPWGKRMYAVALLALIGIPPIWLAWSRRIVMDNLRRHREIRIDMKLNALLGLITFYRLNGEEHKTSFASPVEKDVSAQIESGAQ